MATYILYRFIMEIMGMFNCFTEMIFESSCTFDMAFVKFDDFVLLQGLKKGNF